MEIVRMLFGSHLYGLSTPDSDTDYKGIYIPEDGDSYKRTINTTTKAKNSKSRNTNEDVDIELFALDYFLKLACEGQTIAMDMLHAPANMILNSHPIWDAIVANRHRFYSKNTKAFVGYAYKQAAKYGIKGSRLNALNLFISLLEGKDGMLRIKDFWDELPTNEHAEFIENSKHDVPQYQICNRIVQATQRVKYTLKNMITLRESYGHRAILAAENKGVDWKAVSHAVRAAYQVKELLIDHTITFPLKKADILLDIKLGKLDYKSEVEPLLEGLIEEVESLAKVSDLPDSVDTSYWANFYQEVIKVVDHEYEDSYIK